MAKSKTQSDKTYIYGARDTSTGKLVSNITRPRRKYWDREVNARASINYYNSKCANRNDIPYSKGRHGLIELVKFELVEVPTDTD